MSNRMNGATQLWQTKQGNSGEATACFPGDLTNEEINHDPTEKSKHDSAIELERSVVHQLPHGFC
jgi:hypothetical protein